MNIPHKANRFCFLAAFYVQNSLNVLRIDFNYTYLQPTGYVYQYQISQG